MLGCNIFDLPAWPQRLRPACLASTSSTCLLGFNVCDLPVWLQRLRLVCLASTSATCLLDFNVVNATAANDNFKAEARDSVTTVVVEASVTHREVKSVGATAGAHDKFTARQLGSHYCLAAQSTAVAHGTYAKGTSRQPTIETNSTEVLNIDGVSLHGVSLQASIVASVVHAVVAQVVAPDVVARAAASRLDVPQVDVAATTAIEVVIEAKAVEVHSIAESALATAEEEQFKQDKLIADEQMRKLALSTKPLPTLELSRRATGFQFGDEPGGISTLVGVKGDAQFAPGELAKAKQSAACELIRAISPACQSNQSEAIQPKEMDFLVSVEHAISEVTDPMGTTLASRATGKALEALAWQPDTNDVNSALASHRASAIIFAQSAAQAADYAVATTQTAAAAVRFTATVHAADRVSPTSLQPASDMNSIQRQQVDVTPATAQVVAQAVVAQVVAAAKTAVAVQTTQTWQPDKAAVASKLSLELEDVTQHLAKATVEVKEEAAAKAARDMNSTQRQQVDVTPATAQAVAQAVVAQVVAAAQTAVAVQTQGTSADGYTQGRFFPHPHLLAQAVKQGILDSLVDLRYDVSAKRTVSQMALQPQEMSQMALQPPNDVNSALASHRASAIILAQSAAQAADYAVVAAQAVVHGVADGVFPPVSLLALQPATSSAQQLSKAVVADERPRDTRSTCTALEEVDSRSTGTALEEAVTHHLAKVAVADKVSASTRHADEMAVNSTYTAQVVAAQSTVAVVASVAAQAVAARAVAAQDEAQDTTVEGVFLPNTAKVDAQYEWANEDEAKVEHVEAKAVATASLALVSTAEVLGTPEQPACIDQSMDRNDDGDRIASQREIWATHRRSIVMNEAKSLHQADAEARMEALEDPATTGVVLSPALLRGAPDNHPESEYLMALGDEVSNNRHISGMIAGLAMAIAVFLLRIVSAKADEVSVALAAAQSATQVAAAAQIDAVAQTISAAYSTEAGGISPMALMPASDTSSAQGQQMVAKVVIREYARLDMLEDVNHHPGDAMVVEPQIHVAPSSLGIPNFRNLTNLERTQGKAFQRDLQCKLKDHALARTALGTGSARCWLHRIWHQRQEHARRSVRRKRRGNCTSQGRVSWHRGKPRQADAGAQGNLKVMARETVTLVMKGAAVDYGRKPKAVSGGVHGRDLSANGEYVVCGETILKEWSVNIGLE